MMTTHGRISIKIPFLRSAREISKIISSGSGFSRYTAEIKKKKIRKRDGGGNNKNLNLIIRTRSMYGKKLSG